MDKQVTIIILTWNGIEYTKKCLQTVHDHLKDTSINVIVVDNGSTDGTVDYLRSLDWVTPVFNEKNLGFVRGNNMGIEMAGPDSDIILLNNDIEIYDPSWIEKLQTTAYADGTIGIVGCRIRRPDGTLQHAGTYMPEISYRGYQIGGREKDINQYYMDRDVEGVVFACVYIKSTVVGKIGGLDSAYFSYYEDTDYCLAAKAAGFRVVVCGSLTVLHHEHVATKINRVDHDDFFLKSQRVFKQKWKNHFQNRFDRYICWHSTFDRPYGYGMISRHLATAMEDHGIGVSYKYLYGPGTVFPVEETVGDEDVRLHLIRKRRPQKTAPHIVFGQGDAFHDAKTGYRIGYTMLETTGIPKKWTKQANQMDEVWTPSPFNAWTFRKSGVEKSIRVMPLGVDVNYFNADIIGYPLKNLFTFLSIFEWGERKASEILLKAFNQTFRKSEPVVLLCKFINHDPTVNVARQIAQLELDPEGGQIIYSTNQNVPYYQLPQLYRSADCFVLPTRGEGWGMPILEAMACGLPVIATFWSAQQEFMNDGNSYPLQVERLIDAEAKCPYYKGFRWAQPDMRHLKRLMRHVYENQDEANKKGSRAAADVKAKWSLDRCGKRIRQRLDEIEQERNSGKGPSVAVRYPKRNSPLTIGLDISRSIGGEVTGVGRASLSLLKGFTKLSLDENPFRFMLLPGLGDFVHPEYMKRYFAENIEDERFTLYRGPLPAFFDPDHYVPGLDLVHSTAYMKPETHDIPLIVTVHDLTFKTHPEFHTRENIRFCNTNIEKAVRSECHFFVDSENTKKDLLQCYQVETDRVSVVYIPIDLDHFHPCSHAEKTKLRRKYDLPDRFFLFVGSLEPRKNLRSIIEALRVYRGDEPLVVIGATGWKNSDVKYEIEKQSGSVRMMGYVPQEELPVFYASALVTLYPSLYEGFGLPVIESMACGTPVVTSRNSSIPEVAGESCLYLKEPVDPVEIAQTMTRLSEDNPLWNRLRDEGLRQAGNFSVEKSARSALKQYVGVLET